MGLYDESRAKDPSKGGAKTTWKKADAEIIKGLNSAGKVAVVTNTIVFHQLVLLTNLQRNSMPM